MSLSASVLLHKIIGTVHCSGLLRKFIYLVLMFIIRWKTERTEK